MRDVLIASLVVAMSTAGFTAGRWTAPIPPPGCTVYVSQSAPLVDYHLARECEVVIRGQP